MLSVRAVATIPPLAESRFAMKLKMIASNDGRHMSSRPRRATIMDNESQFGILPQFGYPTLDTSININMSIRKLKPLNQRLIIAARGRLDVW